MNVKQYGLILLTMMTVIAYIFGSAGETMPVAANTVRALETALQTTGAQIDQTTIHGWTVLPWADASEQELAVLAEMAVRKLDLPPGKAVISRSASGRHKLVRFDVTASGYEAAVIAQVLYPLTSSGKPEVYLVINIDSQVDGADSGWEDKITQIIAEQGGKPHISTCLTGWIDGKLDDEQKRALLNHAFLAIHATVHDTVSDFDYISMSGFSPAMVPGLSVNGRKVNINMAMRYSSKDNRTYCIAGSPVVTREY